MSVFVKLTKKKMHKTHTNR